MLDPVIINFAIAGVQNIERAFDTVEARIIKLEQASTRASEAGSRTRVRGAQSEAQDRERAYQKMVAGIEREEKNRLRGEERQAKTLDQIRRRSAEMAGRYAEQEAKKEIREREQAVKQVERLEEYKRRVMMRSAEWAGRAAEAEVKAEATAREKMARGVGGAATRGLKGTVGGFGGMLAGGLAIGGGFAMADIAKRQMNAERQAATIVNEVTVGGKTPAGANVANILGASSQVSRETGMSKEDVQAGMLAYTRSAKGGDFGNAMANMGFFAKMAKVTGADITDVATGAGLLQSQNQGLKAPQMQQMLLDMMAQGHAGSKSISEMISLAGVVGSARGVFGTDSTTTQRKLLGLTQLAAPEAGSAEEAARGVKQMALQVEKTGKKGGGNVDLLKLWGVKYNEHGQVGDVEQMILATLGGTKGNLQQIGKVFETRSGGLMRHMADTYNKAGGGSTGIEAARAEMASVTQATTKPEELEDQFQKMMSTPAEKFQKALNDISETVGQRLEPVLEKLADTLAAHGDDIEKLMTSIVDLAEWLIDNPWKGIGAAVLGSIIKEMAAGNIGQAVAAAIVKYIASGAMPVPGASGVPTGGIGIAGVLGVVGVGVAAAYVEKKIIDSDISDKENDQRKGAMGGVNEAQRAAALRRKIANGTVTAQDVADANSDVKGLTDEANKRKKDIGNNDMGMAQTAMMQLVDPTGAKQHAQDVYNEQVRVAKMAKDALQDMTTAARAAADALNNHGTAVANGDPARHGPIDSPGRT